VLLTNGKLIALGIIMYCADNDGRLPSAGSVESNIHTYVPKEGVFCRPGTNDSIFRYLDPGVAKESDIAKPAGTRIGELDAGYGWIAGIYADGHVQVLPKQ